MKAIKLSILFASTLIFCFSAQAEEKIVKSEDGNRVVFQRMEEPYSQYWVRGSGDEAGDMVLQVVNSPELNATPVPCGEVFLRDWLSYTKANGLASKAQTEKRNSANALRSQILANSAVVESLKENLPELSINKISCIADRIQRQPHVDVDTIRTALNNAAEFCEDLGIRYMKEIDQIAALMLVNNQLVLEYEAALAEFKLEMDKNPLTIKDEDTQSRFIRCNIAGPSSNESDAVTFPSEFLNVRQ